MNFRQYNNWWILQGMVLGVMALMAAGCAGTHAGQAVAAGGGPASVEPDSLELPGNLLVQSAARELRIRLIWMTETEENAFCFFVYRSDDPNREPELYNAEQPVAAHGTTQIPHKYYFYDLNVEPDKVYYYKLELVNLDGSREWIFGEPEPLTGRSKPLTDEDRALLAEHGQTGFSIENF